MFDGNYNPAFRRFQEMRIASREQIPQPHQSCALPIREGQACHGGRLSSGARSYDPHWRDRTHIPSSEIHSHTILSPVIQAFAIPTRGSLRNSAHRWHTTIMGSWQKNPSTSLLLNMEAFGPAVKTSSPVTGSVTSLTR